LAASRRKLEAAREIVLTYIVEGSALEVNLSAGQRQAIEKKIPMSGKKAKVPNNLFLDAQKEVYLLLDTNYFVEFLEWGPKMHELRSKGEASVVAFRPRPPSTRRPFSKFDHASMTASVIGSLFESEDDANHDSFSSFQSNAVQQRIESIRFRKETLATMANLERVKFNF